MASILSLGLLFAASASAFNHTSAHVQFKAPILNTTELLHVDSVPDSFKARVSSTPSADICSPTTVTSILTTTVYSETSTRYVADTTIYAATQTIYASVETLQTVSYIYVTLGSTNPEVYTTTIKSPSGNDMTVVVTEYVDGSTAVASSTASGTGNVSGSNTYATTTSTANALPSVGSTNPELYTTTIKSPSGDYTTVVVTEYVDGSTTVTSSITASNSGDISGGDAYDTTTSSRITLPSVGPYSNTTQEVTGTTVNATTTYASVYSTGTSIALSRSSTQGLNSTAALISSTVLPSISAPLVPTNTSIVSLPTGTSNNTTMLPTIIPSTNTSIVSSPTSALSNTTTLSTIISSTTSSPITNSSTTVLPSSNTSIVSLSTSALSNTTTLSTIISSTTVISTTTTTPTTTSSSTTDSSTTTFTTATTTLTTISSTTDSTTSTSTTVTPSTTIATSIPTCTPFGDIVLFYLLGTDSGLPSVDQHYVKLVTDANGDDTFMQFTDDLEEASQFEFTAGCSVITADYMSPNSELGQTSTPLRFDYFDVIAIEGYIEDICTIGSDGSFTCQALGGSTLYVCTGDAPQVQIGPGVASGCSAVDLQAFTVVEPTGP